MGSGGYTVNSESLIFSVTQASSPQQIMSKEFIRTRIASSQKPTSVEFYYSDGGTLLNSLTAASLKDYGAYEQYIPRQSAAPNNRMQGRLLIYKIIHNLDSEFTLVDTAIQYKLLK